MSIEAIFALLVAAGSVIVAIVTYLPKLIGYIGSLEKLSNGLQILRESLKKLFQLISETSTKETKSRKKLLQVIKTEVTQRWQDSLHREQLIALQIKEQNCAVGRQKLPEILAEPEQTKPSFSLRRLFQRPKQATIELKPSKKIIEVFQQADVNQKLLILGAPGSGKTTTLLELAKDLLEQATAKETAAIPVIFELSTWQNERQSIAQWLAAQLKENYNLPVNIGKKWLANQQILPLLDGLDELGLSRQKKCVTAINQFLAEDKQRQLVVCCRTHEYEAGEVKLNELNGAICLQSLSEAQIQDYLQHVGRPSLWEDIEENGELRELATSPLLLTIMVTAYQGESIRNRQELFDAYLQVQFENSRSNAPYSRKETRRYLSWLAKQLKAESETEFLIEKMQPSWLGNSWRRLLYRLIAGMVAGLITGLIAGLAAGLVAGRVTDHIIGLTRGLEWAFRGGSIVCLIVTGLNVKIEPIEAWNYSLKGLKKGLIVGLIGGIIWALIFVILIPKLIVGIASLIQVLIISLIIGFNADIKIRINPNQGIRESAKNFITISLLTFPSTTLFFLILRLATGRSVDWVTTAIVGFALSCFFGFIFGGIACIQHLALRLILWQSGSSPWNYARFLSHARELRFIQQVGGRYRFIHDLLREHFAGI